MPIKITEMLSGTLLVWSCDLWSKGLEGPAPCHWGSLSTHFSLEGRASLGAERKCLPQGILGDFSLSQSCFQEVCALARAAGGGGRRRAGS